MNDLHNRWIEGLAPEHSAQIYASCSALPIFPLFAALRDHGGPPLFRYSRRHHCGAGVAPKTPRLANSRSAIA